MAASLRCPVCDGKSVNRRPRFAKAPDGVMRPVGPRRCWWSGSLRGADPHRAFYCGRKEA